MSFPYMKTHLTKRLVFNKQERGKCFTGSYVLSLYEYKSHKETCIQQASRHETFFTGSYVLSLYEYISHKETCIQQASRQERAKADRE